MTVYRINHLERLPLKTPYPAQLERIRYIIARLPRETDLVVDFTGVGRGIFDMAVDAGLRPIGVTIHSGFEVRSSGDIFSVPKSTLVSTLVGRLHAGELVVHESLKDWPILRRELLNFRPEITRSGVETWNARSGEHDDLVLALGLAVFHLTGSHVRYRGLLEWYRREAGAVDGEQWAVGVDLGQAFDPTAIAVLSKSGAGPSAVEAPPAVILRGVPYMTYQAASGQKYTVAEDGRIAVADQDDARDLLRMGCQAQR